MDWTQSIQRALSYIESHLLEELDNEGVAKSTYSSEWNFQRIFSIITGVTVSDYIRCRRLTLAGEELARSGVRVIDAALKYGYDTPESFSKAFLRFHGVTPSEARSNADSLKRFEPIFLRIEVKGGFNVSTKIIPNIPPVINSWFGENYHFNGVARYIMGCLGEMKLSDYSLFAGLTGDIFAQFYPLGSFRDDSASDFHLGLHGLPEIFERVGYAAESFSERELQKNYARLMGKITGSVDRGIPVIWYHGCPKGVIVGYEGDGKTLLYLSGSKTEPERLVLDDEFFGGAQTDIHGFIVVGGKKSEVSLKEIYRDAILRLPKLLTTHTDEYVFGAQAFRAWAEDIESGRPGRMDPKEFDGNFFAHEVYIVNMATNSGGCQSFLEKAQEMNPDLTFLGEVRRQYRITNYLWNGGYWIKDVLTPEEREDMMRLYGDKTLESLGGAFGCKLETLRDKQRGPLIVKILRACADCMDKVVQLLNDNLGDCEG